jgi:RNA polymerase sigma factor (TIGR02999 family)
MKGEESSADDDSEAFDAGSDLAPEVTRLLHAAESGDSKAAAALLPAVYEQLRRLAQFRLRQNRADQTLQATALVHEAYLRLAGKDHQRRWQGRNHFFAAAAEAMRCILVDEARRRSRLKRGGGMRRVNLEDMELTVDQPPDELLSLDEALRQFAQHHPEKAELVKLRYFAGLTIDEAAEALDIGTSTAERHWAFARAWLYRQIADEGSGGRDEI